MLLHFRLSLQPKNIDSFICRMFLSTADSTNEWKCMYFLPLSEMTCHLSMAFHDRSLPCLRQAGGTSTIPSLNRLIGFQSSLPSAFREMTVTFVRCKITVSPLFLTSWNDSLFHSQWEPESFKRPLRLCMNCSPIRTHTRVRTLSPLLTLLTSLQLRWPPDWHIRHTQVVLSAWDSCSLQSHMLT